jgi:Domain of unknown function (DUF6484)
MTDHLTDDSRSSVLEELNGDGLDQLLALPMGAARPAAATRIDGVRIGTLVGFADGGATPLVVFADQPAPAAQPARATLDLHGAHIGRPAVLMFEEGDPGRPIVVGCLRDANANGLPAMPGQLEVESDGQRLVVSARDQIVVRCGKASITLTKEGKVIVQGEYVSSHSSGVLRLKGGSVHIN